MILDLEFSVGSCRENIKGQALFYRHGGTHHTTNRLRRLLSGVLVKLAPVMLGVLCVACQTEQTMRQVPNRYVNDDQFKNCDTKTQKIKYVKKSRSILVLSLKEALFRYYEAPDGTITIDNYLNPAVLFIDASAWIDMRQRLGEATFRTIAPSTSRGDNDIVADVSGWRGIGVIDCGLFGQFYEFFLVDKILSIHDVDNINNYIK